MLWCRTFGAYIALVWVPQCSTEEVLCTYVVDMRGMAQIGAPSGRALWRYAAPAGANATLVSVQACVKTNVLQEATLAIYEDGRLAWSADEGLMIECPYQSLRRL